MTQRFKVSKKNTLSLCNLKHEDFGKFAAFLDGLEEGEFLTLEGEAVETGPTPIEFYKGKGVAPKSECCSKCNYPNSFYPTPMCVGCPCHKREEKCEHPQWEKKEFKGKLWCPICLSKPKIERLDRIVEKDGLGLHALLNEHTDKINELIDAHNNNL